MASTGENSDLPLDLERRIVELCQQSPTGLSEKILQGMLGNVNGEQRVKAINRLLSQGKIALFNRGNQLIYRIQNPGALNKVKGADSEEKLVYQIIERAGNKGIWSKDIRSKSGVAQTNLTKILKSLESKKLIKAVKSVAAGKKKVYMLSDLEPDNSVTGGTWYSDQTFESEFVEVLNQQCYKYLQDRAAEAKFKNISPIMQQNAASATSKEIWTYIAESGISNVKLSIGDIEQILGTLIFDGKVMKKVMNTSATSEESGCVNIYRAVEPLSSINGLVQIPCGFCPVINRCSEDGEISPASCVYMKEWLESAF